MAFSARPRLPLADRWEMIFPRVLHSCGIPLDDLDGLFNKDDVRHITDIYLYGLTPRPGLAEMLQTLKEGGIDFWCCSGAGVKRVKNYFARAGIDMPETQIWDTSRVGVSKPQLPVYETLVCEWQEKLPGEVMIFGGEWFAPQPLMLYRCFTDYCSLTRLGSCRFQGLWFPHRLHDRIRALRVRKHVG
jgi:hypothetical protein